MIMTIGEQGWGLSCEPIDDARPPANLSLASIDESDLSLCPYFSKL
jgi:hypothetical protein